MPELLVRADRLCRTFLQGGAPVPALVFASFRIHRGDRIALMGRSGSGKSTLMHQIAGLDAPSGGTLEWPGLGAREDLLPARVALAFQVPSLLPALTVEENVALPLLMAGQEGRLGEAVATALATFGIADLASRLPEELSGGQMQRVALARAIVGAPDLILADEPTGQLDHQTSQEVLDALLGHVRGTQAALLVATHDPAVAQRMDCLWQIQDGALATGGETGSRP